MVAGTPFTEDEDRMILEGIEAGYTAETIAHLLGNGRTRNAVLGRLHRIRTRGETKPKKPAAPKPPKPQPQPAARYSPPLVPAEPIKVELPVEPIVFDPPPVRRGPDMRLRFEDPWPGGRCRYPLFDGRPKPGDDVFCGQPVSQPGQSFCPSCSGRVFMPRPVKEAAK